MGVSSELRFRALLLGLLVGVVVRPARADAYAWGGASARFEVHVVRSGFDDGAGVGGWDESSARRFASWAARFNAIIPPRVHVSLVMDMNDVDTTLRLRIGGRHEQIRVPGAIDFDRALARLAVRLGAKRIPPLRAATLYTIQLFASRSRASAEQFAADLNAREVRADGQLYYEACLPCWVPESRVLEPLGDGLYRVVTGVFDRNSTARRAARQLYRDERLTGFVRTL